MKIHHIAVSLILFAILPLQGQEANPFIKKEVSKKSLPAPGATFCSIVEYISIPSELLNPWLEQHPTTEDAAELRKQAQVWITEKKASVIHTLFTAGAQHREAENQNIAEQIYPTEFMPSEAETWLYPTSFETRNMGITVESVVAEGTEGKIEVGTEWVSLLEPSACYHRLTDQTRKPGDMFMPQFWSFKVSQMDAALAPPYVDPFSPKQFDDPRRRPSFTPGKTYLAGRVNLPAQDEGAARSSLLVFFRGAISSSPVPSAPEKTPAEYRISARLVEMPHAEFSLWLQGQEPQAAAAAAWSIGGDHGTTTMDLTTAGRKGTRIDVSQVDECIYPTEYQPPADTKAKPEVPSTPVAFETRNTGNTLTAVLSDDAQGLFLEVGVERVAKLGETVMRRRLSESEWIPDMAMPFFASYKFASTIRPERGKWMLVSSGPEFSATGQPATDKISLLFIKVD